MSSLTPCNYCHLQWFREIAASNGEVIELRPGGIGIDVYARRPDAVLDTRSPDAGNTQWKASFMTLTNECVC